MSAAPYCEQTPLYVRGAEGYHTFRIPAVVETTVGTILAVCEGRKTGGGDSGEIDMVVRRSLDGGDTWSDLKVIWHDAGNTCGNPCPVVDRDTGTVWLLMTHNLGEDWLTPIVEGTAKGTRTVWVTRSDDDGRTWAEPVDITESTKAPEWTWYATGPGAGVQMRDGRLVVPCDHGSAGGEPWGSHVICSDDHGATWRWGERAPDHNTDECEAVELEDGRLLLNMRNHPRGTYFRRAVATSDDGGETWSPVRRDARLVESACQASIRRLSWAADGGTGRVLFSNPAHQIERVAMTIRLSYDDCETWPVAKTLHAGPSAYSSLAVTSEGRILCLYERGDENAYETITLARLNLEWVTEGEDSLAARS